MRHRLGACAPASIASPLYKYPLGVSPQFTDPHVPPFVYTQSSHSLPPKKHTCTPPPPTHQFSPTCHAFFTTTFTLIHPAATATPPLPMARSSTSKAAFVCAIVAALASAAVATPHPAAPLFPTAVQLRARFDDADFAIDTNKIRGAPTDAGNIRAGNQGAFPVLGLPGVDTSFALISLEGGAHNLPHTHPRGSETLFLTKGTLEVFIVEENGPAVRVIENTLRPGGLAVFPAGLIHGQRCVSRGGCEAVAVLGSGDPGTIQVSARLCDAPVEAVASALGVSEEAAARVCAKIPGNPGAGQPAKDKYRQ